MTIHQQYLGDIAGGLGFNWIPSHHDINTIAVEVHWVHSSCDVEPGKTLGACLSESCANPNLRVETQVFTVVNDRSALNFDDFSYGGNIVNGYHQAKTLPTSTGTPVEFLGSTTGPAYTE